MRRLFLVVTISANSIYASASNKCGYSLTLMRPQLVPYIYQVINSNEGDAHHRLEALRKLIGIKVRGEHISYPEGQTYKRRILAAGVIQDVTIIKPSEDIRTIIYEMTISSEKKRLSKFSFSGSYSPAFSILEADQALSGQIAEKVAAVQNITLPFDLLSVGLDTPLEVVEYKKGLHSQGAVVFHDQRHSYYELARFYEIPIIIDGEIWPSAGHYVEANKFVDSQGSYTQYAFDIRIATLPAEVIKISGDQSSFIRPDWEEVRDEIMLKALTAKFTQYRDLYKSLMDTEDAYIVEHVEEDHYWGDGEDGTGKSILGELLMKLRDQFRQGIMPGYEFPIPATAVWGQLLLRIKI